MHATIPKVSAGDFEFTVLQRLIERMAREAMNICLRMLKESNKSRFDSYSARNSELIVAHINFRIVACTFFPTTFPEIAVCTIVNSVGPPLRNLVIYLFK